MHDAPSVAGPRSEAAFAGLFGAWSRARRLIAVVVAPDDALQHLQMRRLLAENAPRHGAIFTTETDADAWIGKDGHARQ